MDALVMLPVVVFSVSPDGRAGATDQVTTAPPVLLGVTVVLPCVANVSVVLAPTRGSARA